MIYLIIYTVKAGDTIASVAEDHQLNAKELLIANPVYKSEDSLLAIGDTVNTTLIDPQITFTYEVHSITDEEQYFEKKTVYDSSKSPDFSEITTPGVVGITRLTEKYKVTNGEDSEGIVKIAEEVIIEKNVVKCAEKSNGRNTNEEKNSNFCNSNFNIISSSKCINNIYKKCK